MSIDNDRPSLKPTSGKAVRKDDTLHQPAPITVTRPELLSDGSDRNFRRLVHGLFGLLARHEAIRAGHGAVIGLAGIEYTVLISIGHLVVEEQTVSINRVTDHLHLSGAFVTTVTNKLLRMGLIHKRQDPEDRRRVRLDVSDAGRTLLAMLAPTQRQVNDVQFECLDRDEFASLLAMIERLIESSDRAMQLQNYLASRRGGLPLSVGPAGVEAA
jgi:DNA-binding MarR family transcriptional regulator